MKVIFIVVSHFFLLSIFVTACSSQPYYDKEVVQFDAIVKTTPQQFKDTNIYILNFEVVKIIRDVDSNLNSTFKHGGQLILDSSQLPQVPVIKRYDKFNITLKKDFDVLRSRPPQIDTDSILNITFN